MIANIPFRYYRIVIIPALILMVGAIYGRTAGFDIVGYDDPRFIWENTRLQEGITPNSLSWAFSTFFDSNWYPLTWISHMAVFRMFGNWPGGHHLVNVLLHAANVVLLYVFLLRTTGEIWRSAWAAALFVVHPLHVESVAWIAERKDVLSGLFFLLTLLAYSRYTERPSPGRYASALFVFIFGLMSKPMLVTLPCVLILLDRWPLRRTCASWTPEESDIQGSEDRVCHHKSFSFLILEKVPFFLLAVISSLITLRAQASEKAIVSTDILPVAQRIERAAIHYGWYLRKFVWPSDLSFYYPIPEHTNHWEAAIATVLIAAITAVVWARRKRDYHLVTGWFWFLGMLVPVIGLVASGMQDTADRYTYLPFLGLYIIVAWLVPSKVVLTANRSIAVSAVAVVILAGLSVIAWRQVSHWKNSRTLSEHAISVTTGNYVALTILGDTLDDEGRSEEAILRYQEALSAKPVYEVARNSLGVALCKQGRIGEAMAEFSRALSLNSSYVDAYANMGVCMASHGRLTEAARYFQTALELSPDHLVVREYLGRVQDELRQAGGR